MTTDVEEALKVITETLSRTETANKFTFRRLQAEHREWSHRNFGEMTEESSWKPMYGLMEELGELAHALLKRGQGIRGSHTHHTTKAKDAVGDIAIFLASACSHLGFDLQDCVEEAWNEVKERDYSKLTVNNNTTE